MSDTNDRANPRSSAPASGDPGFRAADTPVVPQLDSAREEPRPTGWSPTSWRSGGEK